MLRDSFVRACRGRTLGYRAIALAVGSLALMPLAARGGTAVSFDRQANGQTFTENYLDGNNQEQTYSWTWPDNANWSQSKQMGADPAGNPIITAPSNWSQDTYPDGDYDISLGGAQVTDDVSVSADTLSLSGELDLLSGVTLNITNGSLVNNGNIVVNWDTGGFGTALNFSADASITGTGKITLNNDGPLAQLDSATGATVTIGSGQNIVGVGSISGTFINNGTIKATVAAGSIDITGTMTNNNAITADDGGTLSFNGTMTNNGSIGSVGPSNRSTLVLSGTINNGANGLVSVGGNGYLESVSIDGGDVWALNAGAYVQASGNSSITDADFQLGGQNHMDILGGSIFTFGGATTVENDGTITVNSDQKGFGTALNIDGDITINGVGDILLNAGGPLSQFNTLDSHTVTLGAQQTLHGSGSVAASIINKGTINADVATGSLDIGSFGVENDNVMEATNQATLNITNITVTNANGQISASNQSVVEINGATVDGGSVSADATSHIDWNNATMSGSITLSGTQNILSATTTIMNGTTLTNNGTIVINSDDKGFGTALSIDADVSLKGSGQILLNNSGPLAQLNVTSGHTLTIQSGQLVHGQGQIGGDIVNNGIITADVSGESLQITPTTGFTNQGSMAATSGSNLVLLGSQFNNYTSITAASNSTVTLNSTALSNLLNTSTSTYGALNIAGQLVLNGATVDGGTINASASGASVDQTGTSTIENATLTLGSGNHLNINSATTLTLDGAMTLTNNGTVTINNDQQFFGTALLFNSDTTVGGTGDILLTSGNPYSQFDAASGVTVTLGAGQTLHGSGDVNAALINQGTISADIAGGSIDIPSATIENDHIMQANNQSALNLTSDTITNTNGQISASNQSAVEINGATINGGAVSADASSHIDWINSTMSGLVTLAGTQNILAGSTSLMNGPTLTNNGKIVINPEQHSFGTSLDFDANVMLNGTGEILLNNSGPYAQLQVLNNHLLTVGAGQLIHGQGQIFGNIDNIGTIRADVAGQTLEFANAVINNGKLDVAGGILQLDNGLSDLAVISQLHSGFNGGAWNGAGIISSLAATHKGTGVGYTSNGTMYTLMYTWLGDTDLNGVVNNDDLTAMSLAGTTWATGDFNYDGKVNADDYSLFMEGAVYGKGNISATLPEPATFFTIVCGAGCLGLRRRRGAILSL